MFVLGDTSTEGKKKKFSYPVISSSNPILTVIINNTVFQGEYADNYREGSLKDVKALQSLKKFGFEFGFEFDGTCFENCTRDQIEALMLIIALSDNIAEALKTINAPLKLENKYVQDRLSSKHKNAFEFLSQNKNINIAKFLSSIRNKPLSKYSGLCVCIMTHGEQGDNLVCSDGKMVSLYDIASYFNAENCSALVNKPKIFIVQACRGVKYDCVKPEGRGHPDSNNDIDKEMPSGK